MTPTAIPVLAIRLVSLPLPLSLSPSPSPSHAVLSLSLYLSFCLQMLGSTWNNSGPVNISLDNLGRMQQKQSAPSMNQLACKHLPACPFGDSSVTHSLRVVSSLRSGRFRPSPPDGRYAYDAAWYSLPSF